MLRYLMFLLVLLVSAATVAQDIITVIPPDHQYVQLYGRFDVTNPKLPRFWAAGACIVTRFSGGDCELFINDQVLDGASHNYIEVKVDNIDPVRIQLRAKTNRIQIAKDLPGGDHTVTITKNTDASVGYLELRGFKCNSLLPPPPVPTRKLEFIGDEITAGVGADNRYTPCDSANWYDQSSAYHTYAAISARNLGAQFSISAVNGVGITRAVGDPVAPMPLLFEKINQNNNVIDWEFKRFLPDVLLICLGRNDNLGDSVSFITGYVSFLRTIRSKYPSVQIVCMTISTGDFKSAKLKNFIPAVVSSANKIIDKRIHALVIDGEYKKGCSGLPAMDEHLALAEPVTSALKKLMAW